MVAIDTPGLFGFFGSGRVPQRARQLRPVRRVDGPNGSHAVLHLGPRVRGYDCWRAVFSTGQTRGDCFPPFGGGSKIAVDLVQPVGRDVFVVGRVKQHVVRIDLELPLHNRIATTTPVGSHFVLAIPREHVGRERRRAYVVGFDSLGFRAQRQGIWYRLP